MLERRKHHRSRSFETATLAPVRDRGARDCVVRNLSAGGAMLLLDEPRRAPVEMEIALRGGVRPARIAWRNDLAVGVAFEPEGVVKAGAEPTPVVSLDAVRRGRLGDERRLAERIARFVPASRRPDRA